MLLTRVVTAVVAILVLVALVFLGSRAVWSVFMLAVALVCSWEWSRFCALTRGGERIYLALSAVAGAALLYADLTAAPGRWLQAQYAVFALAAAFWVVVAPLWLARAWRPGPVARAVAGWIVIWPLWMAAIALRDAGPWTLLAAAALIWVADIAAYFVGRRFGRHKLAPAVSPGKTWEGAFGALGGVAVYAVIVWLVARAQFLPLAGALSDAPVLLALVAMLALGVLGIVGDLFESWMKRGAGLKDSSALLPGHGGVLDRIDALTSSLPVAALLVMLAGGGA